MGRKSKAAISRAQNLPPKPKKVVDKDPVNDPAPSQSPSRQTTIEDCDDDDDSASENEFSGEIDTEDDLRAFASKLQAAHNKWVAEEREKQASRKRKKHYDRKSDRTIRRRVETRRNLKKIGFPSVLECWSAMQRGTAEQRALTIMKVSSHHCFLIESLTNEAALGS